MEMVASAAREGDGWYRSGGREVVSRAGGGCSRRGMVAVAARKGKGL